MRLHSSLCITLVVWGVIVGISAGLAAVFAWKPQWMLWIEHYQPGASIQRGLALLQENRNSDALEAFERGYAYFDDIYQRTGADRHKLLVVQSLLGMAHVYKNRDFPEDWREAERLYRQAIELEPDWPGGQPHLSLGEVYLSLEDYQAALQAFNRSLERSSGRISMESYYGRGAAALGLGDFSRAAHDWYVFVRYHDRALRESDWLTVNALQPEQTSAAEALFVRGVSSGFLNQQEEAIGLLTDYLERVPDDPAAAYHLASLQEVPAPQTPLDQSLADQVYPPVVSQPAPFLHLYLDVYKEAPSTATLVLTLSADEETSSQAEMEVLADRQSLGRISPLPVEPTEYRMPFRVSSVRTIVELREHWVAGRPQQPAVYLHSIHIEP